MKTVFVLGAGASLAYGFPTGNTLRDEIIHNYAGVFPDDPRNSQVRGQYDKFISDFKRTKLTIDEFTRINGPLVPGRPFYSKVAIMHNLVAHERTSEFYEHNPHAYPFVDLSQDWYQFFIQHFFQQVHSKADVFEKAKEYVFITFNYERSLEFCLQGSLNALFDMELDEFPFEIIHVYGSLGSLKVFPYGSNWTPEGTGSAGNTNLGDISLMGDAGTVERTTKTESVKKHFIECQKIIFLGFSYQSENMKTLGLDDRSLFHNITLKADGIQNPVEKILPKKTKCLIYGTAQGISLTRREGINSQYFDRQATLQEWDCVTLLSHYLS